LGYKTRRSPGCFCRTLLFMVFDQARRRDAVRAYTAEYPIPPARLPHWRCGLLTRRESEKVAGKQRENVGGRRSLRITLYLEVLSSVDTIVLDKTWTLTLGTPEILDVHVYNGYSPRDVIRIAATTERFSEHPLAKPLSKGQLIGLYLSGSPQPSNTRPAWASLMRSRPAHSCRNSGSSGAGWPTDSCGRTPVGTIFRSNGRNRRPTPRLHPHRRCPLIRSEGGGG
jgi:hypothetical protein